jgi:hypothetical protein
MLKESHQVGHGVTNSISTSAEAIEIAEMLKRYGGSKGLCKRVKNACPVEINRKII